MSVDFDWRVDPDCRSSCQLVHLEDLRCFVPSTVTEAPASVANIAYPTKERKTCFCDQSLRSVEEVNLPALISNLACLGHKEAIQSLLEGVINLCLRPRRQLFQLMFSLICWSVLLVFDELRVRHRVATFSLETWSECCGLCQNCMC